MGGLLQGVKARPGDLWLIRAGLVHAIGAGCTIIEVQEPTDFTIQPERWCGDHHLGYEEEYIGLTKDIALDAINYDIYGAAAREYARILPRTAAETPPYKKEVLISHEDTPCFAMNRHTLKEGGSFIMDYAPCVYICLEGEADIVGGGYKKSVRRGNYFYLPYAAEGKFSVTAGKWAVLIECLPGQQE